MRISNFQIKEARQFTARLDSRCTRAHQQIRKTKKEIVEKLLKNIRLNNNEPESIMTVWQSNINAKCSSARMFHLKISKNDGISK